MQYTVKKLAELSGVSVRTLHFYDEIGLLKPAAIGDNGYRYYGKEEVLLLQQILFFRELGIPLAEIQRIVTASRFDKVASLRSHRTAVAAALENSKRLIATIDKTIASLERGEELPVSEMFKGFDPKKQSQFEQELIERYGEAAKKDIADSKRRTAKWTAADFEKVKNDYDAIHRELTSALRAGEDPDSANVQAIIKRHYAVVAQFWTPNSQSYIGLGQLYLGHRDFRKLYEGYDPGLAEYLVKAMQVYAQTNFHN